LNTARNWTEFREALRRFPGPGQNFVYADVDGNIGYQATGMLPVRRNYDGDVPVDGTSGEFEWDGYIPFDQLPSIYNPASGVIVTANQNPFPHDWPNRVNGNFDPGYRASQIKALLSARKGWKPEEMIAVQKDVYSAYLRELAGEIVKAADAHGVKDPSIADAVKLLREWNGQVEKDLAAPMIMQLVYRQIFKALAERAGGPNGPTNYLGSISNAGLISVVKRRPPEWTGDWNQLLVRCLVSALEEGRNAQGSNVNNWQYGRFLTLELKHPILSRIPYVDYIPYFTRLYSVTPAPMSGSSTSVKQTSARVGPSMRFVANTADWNDSWANVTLGQSGQPLSGHYKDQWDEYWSGRSLPFRWTGVSGDELVVEPGR
jgi:penicillin amidase